MVELHIKTASRYLISNEPRRTCRNIIERLRMLAQTPAVPGAHPRPWCPHASTVTSPAWRIDSPTVDDSNKLEITVPATNCAAGSPGDTSRERAMGRSTQPLHQPAAAPGRCTAQGGLTLQGDKSRGLSYHFQVIGRMWPYMLPHQWASLPLHSHKKRGSSSRSFTSPDIYGSDRQLLCSS